MLETLNVWVDVVGMVLAVGVVLGFIVPHFILSVLTGRVRKHFVEDYWDSLAHRMHDPETYGYKQPLGSGFPPPVRVWHWINIVSFTILLVSGLYIRYPFFTGGRETMRLIHYIFMYIITGNLIFRFVLIALNPSSLKDYLLFDRQDLKVAPMVIKYYTFLGPPYPHYKKFNPLQRPTYPMIWGLLTLQAITGFLIWRPTLAGPLAGFIGGPADLAAWSRLVHQINMRLMVMIATVHSYLGIMEDYPVLKVFWFWQEPDLTKYEHEEHGHGGQEAAAHESSTHASQHSGGDNAADRTAHMDGGSQQHMQTQAEVEAESGLPSQLKTPAEGTAGGSLTSDDGHIAPAH